MKLSITVVAINTGIAGRLRFEFSAIAISIIWSKAGTAVVASPRPSLLGSFYSAGWRHRMQLFLEGHKNNYEDHCCRVPTLQTLSNSRCFATSKTLKSHKKVIKKS